MSFETSLDTAFTILLGKAQGSITQGTQPVPPPTTTGGNSGAQAQGAGLDFIWGGGGAPLSIASTDPVTLEVPFPSRLTWVHLYAGDARGQPLPVSATFDVRLTKVSSFGGGTTTPLYGNGGQPSLVASATDNVGLNGWILNLDAGDAIIAYPTAFTGSATWMALIMQLLPVAQTVGVSTVQNGVGADLTDGSGNTLVFRS